MWPDEVERIAIFLRASGTEGTLEELPDDAERPPGIQLVVTSYECDGNVLVILLPDSRIPDDAKVSRAASCQVRRRVTPPAFPYQGAKVLLDLAVLSASTVWLEIGSGKHVLGLAPAQLARLTEAQTADLVAESGKGEVDDGTRG
jgi:hypothetical protein